MAGIKGVSRQSHISFAGSENLRLYVIFLKENKLTSFLEIFAEFSSHREKKNPGSFKELLLSSFPFKNRIYIIYLKENRLTSFLEVFAEFSLHREGKSRQFQRIVVE